ncbi:protein dispatched homolog 2 [Hypomesus transpacificus]|uniref:protein dispatched homolog 2 n=1 Tax=Hypomesus transpacificus TaxID=137520 RepID=UPI001F0719A3|nr:protein dispatched homolog 2 [Hypomesus transpacificus]
MDAVSITGESSDAIVMDSPRAQRPTHNVSQCEIPELSLCPPDSECVQLQLADSLPRPCSSSSSSSSSSSQLYHQVPQGPPYHPSPQPPSRHPPEHGHCCTHHQPTRGNACPNTHPVTDGSHPDCSTGLSIGGKTGHGRSPAHVPSCHNAVRCHWLQGSHEGGAQKRKQRHVVTVRDEGLHWIPRNFSQLVVEYPVVMMLGCALVLLGCSLAGLLIGPLPDFSDPLMGFEPRGTYIGLRQSSLEKLLENTGPGRTLSVVPQLSTYRDTGSNVDGDEASVRQEESRLRSKRMLDKDPDQDTFLCQAPGEQYAQLVFRSGNSASLWSLKSITTMCEMEQTMIRSQAHFQGLCQQQPLKLGAEAGGEARGGEGGGCCPSWSLGNYLAVLSNASSCLSLNSHHVSESLSLLRYCAPFYHHGSLSGSCHHRPKQGSCVSVPTRCKHSHAVYQILHFLVDKDFLGPETVQYQVPSLKYSLLFLPVEKGEQLMDIYIRSLEGQDLTYKNTTITGMDLGIKQTLFKHYLARDSIYPVLAVASLLFTMALYLRSLFISALALVAVTGSLFTSYFLYKVAFRMAFFPLLNLSAVLILLGSCSNQAFTFVDFWSLQLSHNPPASLEKRVNRVVLEVGYLTMASGLTSSAAFFCGYLSSITAVRCFSIYLGTASLISTLVNLVWLPCALVIRERYSGTNSALADAPGWNPCCSKNPGGFWDTSSRKRCLFSLAQKLRGLKRGLAETSNLLFLKILPCGVVKFRYIWVCWFAVLAAGGTYISCVDPGMKLPTLDSRATQLFRSSHPFERYDAEYRHMFMFERQRNGEDKPLTLTLVWGVIPTDNGDHFDPKSNGSLVLDPEFNMSSPEAQLWLRELCERVQNQSFYSPTSSSEEGRVDSVCLVEQLVRWVSIRRCSESEDSRQFCCNDIPFPYPAAVFEQCVGMMVAERHSHAEGHLSPGEGGLFFQPDGRIAALVLAFRTIHFYSFNFSQTSLYYRDMVAWFAGEMSEAPPGLRQGWFISQLTLFDLQQSLSSETLVVAGVSIALTFTLLLLTTWNIPLSIYGMAAVGGSVFVTVGLLVLLEWQLSGVEALFISAAAGLSVDFVANYCISYSSAPHSDRIGRVAHSVKRMGCPVAVGSGAFFCVGIVMLPATALLFRKLGIFLFLVKCVACGFATFFFQSLCCFFGPQRNCGKISLPCSSEKVSEGMLSSRSTADPAASTSTINGAYGRSRVRRNYNKDGGGYLYPNHQRQRQRQGPGEQESEQYELQPLACQLSDSFENSTCTSKLSNRPSVLSDDIQFCGPDVERREADADSEDMCSRHPHKGCHPPPALQTSSPYRENTLRSATPAGELTKDQLLCKACRGGQSAGGNRWSVTMSSSSSMEDTIISQTLETMEQPSIASKEKHTGGKHHPHSRLLSSQSQSSFEGLENSNETCLSDIEPGPSQPHVCGHEEGEGNGEPQPGHLNGRRDALHLSLRETVYETGAPGCGRSRSSQGEEPVILPNSKPDQPDVWIKRDGAREETS